MSDLGQGFGDQSDLLVPGNLDLFSRPRVQTSEGTATVRSMSFGTDKGEVLVPTVHPEGRIMSDEEAMQRYRDTGEHLGIFKTPEAATAYAQWLHGQQAGLLGKTGGAPGWTAEDEARAQEQARTADVPPNVRDYMAHEEDLGENDRGGRGVQLFDEGEQPDRSKALHDQLWNRPDVHDRLIDARLNGHSWGDIQSHMAAHYDNGGTREQLGFTPAEGLMARLDAHHSQAMRIASSTRDEGVGTLTTLAEHGTVGQPAKQPFAKFDTSGEPSNEPVIGPAATPTEQRAIENMEAETARSYSASRDRDI